MKTANINFRAGNVQNLILFRKFEDFIIYFEPRIEKFPHYEHFALETDIKNCLHRIIELIIRTKWPAHGQWEQFSLECECEHWLPACL